jgi:hypothetical protein
MSRNMHIHILNPRKITAHMCQPLYSSHQITVGVCVWGGLSTLGQ